MKRNRSEQGSGAECDEAGQSSSSRDCYSSQHLWLANNGRGGCGEGVEVSGSNWIPHTLLSEIRRGGGLM